jgi:chromosome segregation ATPase
MQKLKESHHVELQSVKNYIIAFKDSLTELYGAVSKLSNDHSLLCSSTLAEASTIYQESLNKIMHSKMEASSHEWDSLTQTLSNTQTEVARISLEFESLKARHNTLQNDMVQCEEKLKASERQCKLQSEQYLSEAETASSEICRLENTFAELQSKYELLEFSKIEQSLEMEQLKSLKASLEMQFTETDSQLKKANADHGSLLSDLGHLIQLFSQDAVMEPVFESFEDMMDPIYAHFESLNSRFEILNEKCSKLIIFKTEMDHIIQDLRATVSLRDTELDDAFEKTTSLESQVEEKDQMIQHLNWLLSQTKEQILAYETQNESAALREEIFNLKAELDQKVTDLESASETLSTLNNKIAQLESEYDAIDCTVKENSRQHELDLSKASEQIQDMQEELHHQQELYKNTLEQHQAALNSLEADLASASTLNSDLCEQLNRLESSLAEKTNELTNKLEEMARMEKDQMDLQATLQSADNQITEMTEKNDIQQRKLQNLESQYESMQQKLMLQEESNVKSRTQVQSLSESLNTQTSILHEISRQMKDMEVKAQSELTSILSLMNHNDLSEKVYE